MRASCRKVLKLEQNNQEIVKRSVRIKGHRTSVSLETAFWKELKKLASERRVSLNNLVAEVDERRSGNLSSALRVCILEKLMEKINL